MAATKTNKDKSKALAALTSAALALPGLNAQAAIPTSSVKTNVSYGHYEESDNRMSVDVYHADAVLPVTDRFELFFSLDRDTYSGATPAYSLPKSMTNIPKYDYDNPDEVSLVDITSAASSAVTTDLLTTFFLNQFKYYKDNDLYLHDTVLNDLKNSPFVQPLLNDSTPSEQIAFLAEAAPLVSSDAPALNTPPSPSNSATSRLTIDAIKTQVYDYVKTTGDFKAAFNSIIQTETDRENAFEEFKEKVKNETAVSRYAEQIDSFNQLIEDEYQSELRSIETDYTTKNNQYETELAIIKQDYEIELNDIGVEFNNLKTLLDQQYSSSRFNLISSLSDKQTAYNSNINKIHADTLNSENLFIKQSADLSLKYDNEKTQLENGYALAFNKLAKDVLSTPEGQQLSNQFDTDKTLLATQLVDGKSALLTAFTTATTKPQLYFGPTSGFSTTNLSSNQSYLNTQYNSAVGNEKTIFDNGKLSLDNQYQNDVGQLQIKFKGDNNQLDTKFNADKALVETTRANAENQYIASNPRPADPPTIANSVTINFPSSSMNLASYAGYANNPPSGSGDCAGNGIAGCYYEDGIVIGTAEDQANTTAHVHRGSGINLADKALQHHADSTGIYIRAQKGEAFSLDSMKFLAPITDANPDSGPNENWEILGFSQAVNLNLDQGDGTNYATRVAYQQIANGFNGTLNLSAINDDFKNVNAVWIHYQGYPKTATDGKEYDLKIDDIVLSPVVAPTKTQIAWDNALQLYKTNYLNNTYNPALANLQTTYTNDQNALKATNEAAVLNLTTQYNAAFATLENTFNNQKNTLTQKLQNDLSKLGTETTQYNNGVTELTTAHDDAKKTLTEQYLDALTNLSAENNEKIKLLNTQFQHNLATLTQNFSKDDQALLDALTSKKNELQALAEQYQTGYDAFVKNTEKELTALDAHYNQNSQALTNDKSAKQTALLESKIKELETLTQQYMTSTQSLLANAITTDANIAATTANTANAAIVAASTEAATVSSTDNPLDNAIDTAKQQTSTALTNQKSSQVSSASDAKDEKLQAVADATSKTIGDYLARQTTIALYRDMLNKMVPTGDPAVQRFMLQPQETRTMPQFSARYYWDATTLSVNGGLSDEPDFLSNFGSFNLSQELNDKLTTVSAGYGMTSNQISRGGGHSAAGHDDHGDTAAYPALNAESTSHNFNASISQVLDKNTIYQFSTSFTHQSGYLSNPYKTVYIRGEVTAEEYYLMNLTRADGQPFDWSSITDLEMVSTELFREVRPDQRNMWSFSNRLNHHIPELDASVHFDYRFYTDDWNINSHTFELKWFQNLPGGWTVTPGIRYYSQSQAEFFAPYFLAPRADGHYSSDFRLSAFGDLSGGVTVSKQFARGITLEAGVEYVTHAGDLKLGGGGVGDYADFDYYIAHANLNIDFGARPFAIGEHAGHHHHHHHGAPVPAGVMFGHMMNQADEIMVGYRYQYAVQSGSMLHGNDPVSDSYLVGNACPGTVNGCLYQPTKMHMQMHMLDLMYAPTDWLNIMVMPQLMSMDMTMSQALRPAAIGEADHGGTQHTSNDLGDTVATALVKLHDDGKHHVHVGVGISAPTGSIDAQISQGQLTSSSGTERKANSAVLQDYGMQLGSGTWDFKPSLTYAGHVDDWGWGVQFSGVKRLNKNKYGYAYGDLFQATSWGSYQILDWLSATVRGVYTWQDKISGESTANHERSSPVDFTQNYGGRFLDVGLGLSVTIPDGQFAGNSISVEWLQPVATDFNGTQLDRDGALAVSWSFSF